MRRASSCFFSLVVAVSVTASAPATAAPAPRAPRFQIEEASVAGLHAAIRRGDVTCRGIIQGYLDRIAAYDHAGPQLNAILAVNAKALDTAAALDARFKNGKRLAGPLHCVPVILKDNYDTADMPTTGASAPLAGSRPKTDATVVARLRDAGAIILAKANLHELALSGTTVSSLGGQTRNPYALDRTPGGSSGGTGAALASNMGIIGFGSDTVNSIRSPASATSLVGLRPSRGLVSRAGIIPVSFTQDAAGPITRNVADAAVVLSVIAGYDPKDPITAYGADQRHDYAAALRPGGLRGLRLGVVETLFGNAPVHEPVNAAMKRALAALERAGATLVPVRVEALDTDAISKDMDVQKFEYRENLNAYLATLGPDAPIKSLADLVATGKPDPTVAGFLKSAQEIPSPLESLDYKTRIVRGLQLQETVMKVFADERLDALVYPHQKRLAVPIGESQADRNGILASITGLPAITVPGGFSEPSASAPIGVPVGIEFLGRPFSEPKLLEIAYSFEQATHYRRPPPTTPRLASER